MLRNYRMYTYVIQFSMKTRITDNFGELTGEVRSEYVKQEISIVAQDGIMASAWIDRNYNHPSYNRTSFVKTMIRDDPAPHILMEISY